MSSEIVRLKWNIHTLTGSRRSLSPIIDLLTEQKIMHSIYRGNSEAHIDYEPMYRPDNHEKYIAAKICSCCGDKLNKYIPFYVCGYYIFPVLE